MLQKRSSLMVRPDWQTEIQDVRLHRSVSELRQAEFWGELFKDKERQRDPATAELFYTEMKLRLMRKFGTITQAFKEIDVSGDGSINFLEWDSMLHLMHLPLENRACRWIFGIASGGDKEIDLGELKVILLQPTMRKMKTFVRSYQRAQERVNQHIHTFITQLSEANQEIRVAAVDRFQRKMKIPFCRDVISKIVTVRSVREQLQSTCIQDAMIERTTLSEIASGLVGTMTEDGLLLQCQVPLMMNITARVGNYRGTSVSLADLMASLVMLSPDVDRCGKLELLFNVFDTDEDTVLEYHQIKDLFVRICKIKPLFEGSPILKEEGGIAFQEELSEQEGLRNYECVRWRLQRGGNNDDAVHWHELWAAMEDQPDVITSLIPAVPLIRWALDAIAVQILDTLPRAITPQRTQKQVAALLSSHPTLGDGWPIASGTKKILNRQRSPGRGGSKESAKMTYASKSSSHMQLGEPWQDTRRPQTSEFRRDLTEEFQRRLRRLSHQRLNELAEGFDSCSSMAAPRSTAFNDADTHGSVCDIPAPPRPSTTQLGSRASLLPRLRGKGSRESFSCGDRRSPLQRVSTAPSGLGSIEGWGESNSQSELSSTRLEKLPLMDSLSEQRALKWGIEAADRHRLLVTARAVNHKGNMHQGTALNGSDAFAYHCKLCNRWHALNPKEKCEGTQ